MHTNDIEQLAKSLLSGELPLAEFVGQVAARTIADVGEAKVDLDRRRRCGFPEVVYGAGKTVAALEKIFHALIDAGVDVFCTRVSPEQAAELAPLFPRGSYHPVARTFRIPLADPTSQPAPPAAGGRIVIVTAGTSDLPVAEEARETALWMGVDVRLIQDVGVAGPQRLLAKLPEIQGADAVVVVAGMEGALPSVVGGHVDCPVIGVPTSVGYGASLGGFSALMSMLNSCAANVTVVNIDAGFKGAYIAGMIARNAARGRAS
ncbi:MAG: nickel pincer cofactor biosynthesis protein LarB [Planctomycetaceae bacterium]|nr:nickel pincer cofactor biosynthesis protein LarB [Planctomycetaceae bacterium]